MNNSSDHHQWLREWYTTQAGKRLLSIEANLISKLLNSRFHRIVLQIGQLGWEAQFLNEETQARYLVAVDQQNDDICVPSLQTRLDALALDSDSVDLIVIPHALEFSEVQQGIIHEAERVLKPEGQLVILSFSPWSLLGVSRILPSQRTATHLPELNYISRRKMQHWLVDTGFDAISSRRLYSGFGRLGADLIEGHYHPVIGASYMIQATKRRYNLIPLRPEWSTTKTKIKQPGFIDASLRKVSNDR